LEIEVYNDLDIAAIVTTWNRTFKTFDVVDMDFTEAFELFLERRKADG